MKHFAVYFPWGRGLGTLGMSWGKHKRHYGDISLRQGMPKSPGRMHGPKQYGLPIVQLYTALDESGKYGAFHCTRKSWYHLRRRGWKFYWQLVRRDDIMGEWKNGKRRVPLYDFPEGGLSERARQLGRYFRPFAIIDWYGERMQVISYPYPSDIPDYMRLHGGYIGVNLRKPDDPTTMHEVILEQFMPETGPIER